MKKVIAIIAGGDSSEHDVSMRSAAGIDSWIDKEKYDVYTIEVRGTDWQAHLHNGNLSPVALHIFTFLDEWNKRVRPDYAYITIHGTPGENGIMQGYFELINIPYSTSSVLIETLTFDKYVLNNYLRAFNVNVADSILLRRGEENKYSEAEIEARLGMPCFVKPAADGSSFGVSKVKNTDQIAPALRNAFMECDEVMIEQYMQGTEVTVGCYKTKEKSVVFPVTEVVTSNEFFDYDAKYNGQVQEITPASISPELTKALQDETSRIYDILHCNGIIRIDYIITRNADGSDRINMLEINTTPGMTATSFIPQQVRAAGLDIKDVLTEIVENQF